MENFRFKSKIVVKTQWKYYSSS